MMSVLGRGGHDVVGILDPPREEATAAIREAHRAGIRNVMIPVTIR